MTLSTARRRASHIISLILASIVGVWFGLMVLTSIWNAFGGTTSSLRGWQAIVMMLVLVGPIVIDICAWTCSVQLNGTLDDRIAVASSAGWTVFTFVALLIAQHVELERLADVLGAFLLTGRFALTTGSIRAWVTSWRNPVVRDDAEARSARRRLAKDIRDANRAVRGREIDR